MERTKSAPFWRLTKVFKRVDEESSLTQKSAIVESYLSTISGMDIVYAIKLLLCKEDVKRIYTMGDRRLVSLFSAILNQDEDEMKDHLNEGDISRTIEKYFKISGAAAKRSNVTLKDVENLLDKLAGKTMPSEQQRIFENFGKHHQIMGTDIKWVMRIIKKDLKIGIGSKYVLDALDPQAYQSWKNSANLEKVVKAMIGLDDNDTMQDTPMTQEVLGIFNLSGTDTEDSDCVHDALMKKKNKIKKLVKKRIENDKKAVEEEEDEDERVDLEELLKDKAIEDETLVERKRKKKAVESKTKSKKMKLSISLNNPVKPMLARASKSFEDALKRCPEGFYSDIKYDGERIQIHKNGDSFMYYSRNNKPVMAYKVETVEEYIEKCTDVKKVILDGEILLQDTKTGNPLPIGTLGKHKKKKFKDATVCIYLFDILYYEGKSLLELPMKKRRKLLKKIINPIPNRVQIAETLKIDGSDEQRETLLASRMAQAIQLGLEGLVLKPLNGVYKPKARHWLKMKKDYLEGMADTADLVVIGGYYGTGSKGGLISTYLMACYDNVTQKYMSVCKVGNGHSDASLKLISDEFMPLMDQTNRDYNNVPDWLDVNRIHMPDFIIKDPLKSFVWEISGAEFSDSTAYPLGVSIRFPRVTRVRDDKAIKDATTAAYFMDLVKSSRGKQKKQFADLIYKSIGKSNPYAHNTMVDDDDDDEEDDKMVDDDDDEEEVVAKKKTTKGKGKYPFKWVFKNVVDTYLDDDNPTSPSIILNPLDNSGVWNERVPTMKHISQKFGSSVQRAYENGEDLNMGNVFIRRVKSKYLDDPERRLFIASMVVQNANKKVKGMPTFSLESLETAFSLIADVAEEKSCNIHMQRFYYRTLQRSNITWAEIEDLLDEHFIKRKINVFLYSTEDHDQNKYKKFRV